MGPIYYQRLKIMVSDKVHSRSAGRYQSLTRQPVSGRANDGGFRVGEMERDSIIAHGTSLFLKESMMERSDKYSVTVNENNGLIDDKQSESSVRVEIPYTMKLLLQELKTMSIHARLITDTDIIDPQIFLNVAKNLGPDDKIITA
jgi:DNA-directed RNA polymerase beta subunit